MPTLQKFRDIRKEMRWRDAALEQIDQFEKLADKFEVYPVAVGSHTSKSIELPVIELTIGNFRFLIRDNFHDLNVCVQTLGNYGPVTLPLQELFEGILKPLDWDWYLGEIARCRGYSWKEWTDEEMDDPKILEVFTTRKDGTQVDWKNSPEKKARWIKRLTDPEWYAHDWSSGGLTWDGTFGPGVTLYNQQHPYAEGISALVPSEALKPYAPGKSCFALALDSFEQVELLIRRLTQSLGV